MAWYRCKLCDKTRIERTPNTVNFDTIEDLFKHVTNASHLQDHKDFMDSLNLPTGKGSFNIGLVRFKELVEKDKGSWTRG